MREFLARHRAAIIAFVGLMLPLFLLYVHGRAQRKTTVIEVALMELTGPVQGAAAKVLGGISSIWNGYIALVDLEEENGELRGEIDALKAQADRVTQLELENGRLRAMLGFVKARRELSFAGAHVIGKDVSAYARVLRVAIDVGADHGIREGMPVINHDGLVGRVFKLSSSYAEVMLTVDARSTVNVRVRDKGVTGTVRGTNSPTSYTAQLLYLHKAEPLEIGDALVTSGHDKVFPPGIVVGHIRSLVERQQGVEYVVEVDPAVNFSAVEQVSVVTGVVDETAAVTPPAAPAPAAAP